MIKKIIKVVLIIFWMGVIFAFSSDNGEASTEKSDSIIINVYQIFNKKELTNKEKEELVEKLVFPIRKLAHLSEYLILGILIISLISEFTLINRKAFFIGLLLCIIYATSDEIHQLFSVGRSARILDILIDTIGSSIGISIYYLIDKKILRRKLYE